MPNKSKTAVDGNAAGGPDFSETDKPLASGGDAFLGGQVDPNNQTSEKDGARTMMEPNPDPGPDLEAHGHANWKNPKRGETLNGANPDGVEVVQRTSTNPAWASRNGGDDIVSSVKLGAHVVGAESLASKMYNPEKGDGLTDVAMHKTTEAKPVAVTTDTKEPVVATDKPDEAPVAA